MTPFEPLTTNDSPVERLLRESPPDEVRAELQRLDALGLAGADAAALSHAHGALALREGRLDDAYDALTGAADGFEAAGEAVAAALSRCEAWLAAIRRGPRSVHSDAIDALEAIADAHRDQARVFVVATHYRATALRYTGRAEATLSMLLEAFKASDGLWVERAQVLNSLGTLYVVLGAYGAATAVLEHAAELNHQIGDRVSEAISYGQLGSSALARGELEQAKTHLQRQEWFASRVGDSFGQARALVLLADLAIDLGRYDDAIDLATQARTIAGQVTPPLTMWVAYATRSIGRALLELEDPGADAELQHARDHFERMGNQLGEALVSWDMARRGARRGGDEQALRAVKEAWRTSAWSFATLGLTGRVTQVLADARAHTEDEDEAAALDRIVAASGQSYPHLGHAQEVELVLSRPDTVSAIATRRIAGQRNLGRLAAQTLAPPGLLIAAVAAAAVGQGSRALPTPRSAATAIGQLPGVALWAWSPEVSAAEVARDLSALRVALGDDTRAALGWFAEAHIVSAPFAGELGAELEAADLSALIAHALTDPPSSLRRLDGVTWDNEAEALARMSGFESA